MFLALQAILGIEQSLLPAFACHVIEIDTHLSIGGATITGKVVAQRQHLVATSRFTNDRIHHSTRLGIQHIEAHADAAGIGGSGKCIGDKLTTIVLPTRIEGKVGGTDHSAQRLLSTCRARHIHAAGPSATVAGIIARGEHADAVRMALAKQL